MATTTQGRDATQFIQDQDQELKLLFPEVEGTHGGDRHEAFDELVRLMADLQKRLARLLLRTKGRQTLADAGGRVAMSVRIDVQQCGDEALVTVHGVVDRTLRDVAAGLSDLGQDHLSVVVDLRDAVLASPHGVRDLVTALRDRARAERIALVCDRVPGRRLLRIACGDAPGVRVLRDVPPWAAAGGAGLSDQGHPPARQAADRRAPGARSGGGVTSDGAAQLAG
jgi:hypothetical protein